MLRENIIRFLNYYPWISFVSSIVLACFPIPYLGWILLSLAITSLLSFRIKNIFQKPTTLLKHIDNLKKPNVEPLNAEEITRFKKFATPNELQLMVNYENFMTETCGITLSEMNELTTPITVQHKNEPAHLAKTYEKDALRTWITTKGISATEPLKRWYQLNDPKIEIYAGFPNWVQSFIKSVLEVLKKHPKTKKEIIADEREQYYQKNFKNLFKNKNDVHIDIKQELTPSMSINS